MKDNPLFTSSELSPSSFKELLPIFFEEIMDDFNTLKNAFTAKDLTETKRLAHKIKGCAASYSAVQIYGKALELQAASAAEEIEKMSELIEELKEVIDATYSYAQKEFQID